ncbi:MAG: carboxy-S-adenosyl-L-methionine synthase CmoA [Pseudomonadota bacterium]
MQDDVYRNREDQIVDFAFNEAVVAVFPDMIRRSVIGYETVIPLTGLVAARHIGSEGTAYDLGCSLGATARALLAQNASPEIRVIGVDNSAPMIEEARALNQDPRLTFELADIRATDLIGAKVVLLNYVLQFIEPDMRLDTLSKIHSALAQDGLLIVSEKIRQADEAHQELFDATHLAWKRANGYTELEVSQKRTALENVMKVDDIATHQARFERAGFGRVVIWYQCMNWVSFLLYPGDA